MKTIENMRKLFLLLALIVAGVQSTWAWYYDDFDGTADYELVKDVTIQGVVYSLYNVTITYGYLNNEKTENLGKKARVKSLTNVTTPNCVIPAYVYDDGIEYTVEGISKYFVDVNYIITSLTFEGKIGINFYNKSFSQSLMAQTGTWYIRNTSVEDFGVCFDNLRLPNLKSLYITDLYVQGTPDNWKFSRGVYRSLTDVYFLDCCPTLSAGMFTSASYITVHLPSKYIKDSMKYATVWSDFKAILPYQTTYVVKVTNNNSHQVEIYSLGKQNYSEDALTLKWTYEAGSSGSVYYKTGENYYLKLYYDATTQNMPTLTRNGEEVTLTNIGDGVAGYQETDVQEDIKYMVSYNNKHCRLGFKGYGAVAGNYEIKRDGQTITGKITNTNPGFVDCDYGSTAILTMPATPYLLKNSLKQIIYGSTITTQNIPLPTPVDGVYTINLTIPSVSATGFEYYYDIPTVVVNEDPVITVMRMGEGEMKLHKFWEWDDQEERWRNEETINCVQTSTQTKIPYPSSLSPKGWGFDLMMTPLKGQVVRGFMVGRIAEPDNGEGRDFILWDDYLEYVQENYDESTNTYTFTIDLENSINDMDFGMQDLDILVDMGPAETIVEDGNKQTFVRQGGTSRVYLQYEDNATEYEPEIGVGTTNIVIPDHSNVLDCTYADLYIDKVYGEKFTAYRDGVDVSGEFIDRGSQFHYDFDKSEAGRAKSHWTILFEKDEDVITGYDWKVIAQNVPEGSKVTIVNGNEEDEHLLAEGVNDIHIVASGLQSARFEIPAIEGFNIMLSRDGEEMGSTMTLANGVYTLIVPDLEILDAAWFVSTTSASADLTEWTVVKTAEVEDAEVRVSVEGGEEETTALTDACTEIDVSNAEYAQLRVKGSVSSSTYDLYLNAYDIANHKLDVIKAVKELTGLGLVETKALVESDLPVKVKGFATRAEAEAAMATLTAIEGTQCSVKNPGVGTFVKVLRNGVDVTADMTPDGDYLMMNVDAADLTRTTWVLTTEELINRFDINNDGTVTISDVTKLVNKILGKE